MPLQFVRNDITRMAVDAIVNPTNSQLYGTSGVDGAVHRLGGEKLTAACQALAPCPVGQARVTPGFNLPARYVIHTVNPVWRSGVAGEQALLESCYRLSLRLAADYGCQSVAFPLLSSGNYGYPKDQALNVAVSAIRAFLRDNDMLVYLVVYDSESFRVSQALHERIESFITDADVRHHMRRMPPENLPPEGMAFESADACVEAPAKARPAAKHQADAVRIKPAMSLEDYLKRQDEGFTQMLLRKIDEKGMTDAACYRRANIDRRVFYKIKTQPDYRPGKSTVTAFAIALELPLDETRDMLAKAGYSLTHSNKFDLIIEYFLMEGCYDIDRINEALFAFDQVLLGSGMGE